MPARSPGVAALKEAFDITYAVHRMEEEGGHRGGKGVGGRGELGHLNEADEDEEEDDEVVALAMEKQQQRLKQQQIEQQQRQSQQQQDKQHKQQQVNLSSGRAGARDQGSIRRHGQHGKTGRSRAPIFQLDMGNATLLGRRQRAPNEPSPLAKQSVNADDDDDDIIQDGVGRSFLGSPMRGVEES